MSDTFRVRLIVTLSSVTVLLLCATAYWLARGADNRLSETGPTVHGTVHDRVATPESPDDGHRELMRRALSGMLDEANREVAAGRYDSALVILGTANMIEQKYGLAEGAYGFETMRLLDRIVHRSDDPMGRFLRAASESRDKKRRVLALLRETAEGTRTQASDSVPQGDLVRLMQSTVLGRERKLGILEWVTEVMEKEYPGVP